MILHALARSSEKEKRVRPSTPSRRDLRNVYTVRIKIGCVTLDHWPAVPHDNSILDRKLCEASSIATTLKKEFAPSIQRQTVAMSRNGAPLGVQRNASKRLSANSTVAVLQCVRSLAIDIVITNSVGLPMLGRAINQVRLGNAMFDATLPFVSR